MTDAALAAAAAAPPSNLPALAAEDEVFELMDRDDEAQILAELSGRVTENYIYEPKYKDGTPMRNERGEPVIGLSYAGVNWACREFSKHGEAIRIVSKPEIQPDPIDPEYVIVSVVAQRVAVNTENGKEIGLDSSVGVKRQWVKMMKKDRSVVTDPFWAEKATSKAQRNAKKSLIPEDFVKQIIKRALENRKNPKPPASTKPAGPAKPAAPSAPSTQRAVPPPPGQKAVAPPAPAQEQKTSAPPPPPSPAKQPQKPAPASPIGALRQKFWVVLKSACQVQDEPKARAYLKAFTGKEKVSDLDEPTLKSLGNILREVTQSVNAIQNAPTGGLQIVDQVSGGVLWPQAAATPQDAQEAPPAAPEAGQEVPPAAPDVAPSDAPVVDQEPQGETMF